MGSLIVVQQGLKTPTGPFAVRFCTGFTPWAGREVFVYVVIDKADGVVFRCTLDGSETQRFLEIPSRMFDGAAAEPFVSLEALNALSALLDLAGQERGIIIE